MCVIGFGIIKNIIDTSPNEMWSQYAPFLGIDKVRFDNYYQDKMKAIGIEIEAIKQVTPISLKEFENYRSKFSSSSGISLCNK